MSQPPPGSFNPYLLSKRLACEKARGRLKDQLSALEERWQPISESIEQHQVEATDTHKRLKDCIREENELAESCVMTETAIKMFRDGSAKLKQRNEDSEEQIDELFHTAEKLKEDIRGKNIRLMEAEEKVKVLSEINKSLLMRLSGQGELQGAESKNSPRASAEGKEKVDAA